MLTPSSWTTDSSCRCRSGATFTSNASSWKQKSNSEAGLTLGRRAAGRAHNSPALPPSS